MFMKLTTKVLAGVALAAVLTGAAVAPAMAAQLRMAWAQDATGAAHPPIIPRRIELAGEPIDLRRELTLSSAALGCGGS